MGESAPGIEPPRYEAWEHREHQRRMFDRPRLWSCSFVNAVENAIDIAHAPFVHKQTLGSDQPLLLPRQHIRFDSDQRGFIGEDDPRSPWKAERPGGIPGGFAGVLARAIGVGNIAKQYYRFDLGGSVHFYIEYESGTFDVLFGHATPADDTHTWFFGGTTRSRALHAVGDAVQRYFMKGLSDEDEVEVSTMWSNDERLLPKLVSAPADEGTLAFRKIWERALEQEVVEPSTLWVASAMTSAGDNT
jgi:phenylpropionate dioxygenase-like ring-hydroxylating dioxygenase large terminal subunit